MPSNLLGRKAKVIRSESLRSERSDASNKRVSFNKAVDVKHIPRGAVVKDGKIVAILPPEEHTAWPTVYRQNQNLSPEELEQEAEAIIRSLDNIECTTSPTPVTYNTHSLDRSIARQKKNNQKDSSSDFTKTLPSSSTKNKLDSRDKNINNNVKNNTKINGNDSSLERRKKADKTAYLDSKKIGKPQGKLKISNMNKLNTLKDLRLHPSQFPPEKPPLHRQTVGKIAQKLDKEAKEKKLSSDSDHFYQTSEDTENDRQPFSYFGMNPDKTLTRKLSPPSKFTDSSPPTSGQEDLRSPSKVIYAQVLVKNKSDANQPSDAPPLSPSAEKTKLQGFSYIGREDASLIGRTEKLDRNQSNFLTRLERERLDTRGSRSPDHYRDNVGSSVIQINNENDSPSLSTKYSQFVENNADLNATMRSNNFGGEKLLTTVVEGPGNRTRVSNHYSIPRKASPPVATRTRSLDAANGHRNPVRDRQESPSREFIRKVTPPYSQRRDTSPAREVQSYSVGGFVKQAARSFGQRISPVRDRPPSPQREIFRKVTPPHDRRRETNRVENRHSSPSREPLRKVTPSYEQYRGASPSREPLRKITSSYEQYRGESPSREPTRKVTPPYEQYRGASPSREALRKVTPPYEHYRGASPSREPVKGLSQKSHQGKEEGHVLRLSVSGSHSSTSAYDSSPTEERRVKPKRHLFQRRTQSSDPSPPPRRKNTAGERSKSSSPERQYVYGVTNGHDGSSANVNGRKPPIKTKENGHRKLSSTELVKQASKSYILNTNSNHLPKTYNKTNTLEKGDIENNKNRPVVDKNIKKEKGKRKIKIKFFYDEDDDETSDKRLSKYIEYKGSDLPPENHTDNRGDMNGRFQEKLDRNGEDNVVRIEIKGADDKRKEQILRQRQHFLSAFLEDDGHRNHKPNIIRPDVTERTENGAVWSSMEEDEVSSGGPRIIRTTRPDGRGVLARGRMRTQKSDGKEFDKRWQQESSSDADYRGTLAQGKPTKNARWSSLNREEGRERRFSPARAKTLDRLTADSRERRGESPTRAKTLDRTADRRRTDKKTNFGPRYFGDTDRESTSGQSTGQSRYAGGPTVRRSASSAASIGGVRRELRRHGSPRRDSLQSSESEAGSKATSHVSTASNKSVFMHAPTVADIPSAPLPSASHHFSQEDLSLEEPRSMMQTKRASRSFSVLAPWKPRHYREKYELHYDNNQEQRDGRPPRPPRKRDGSPEREEVRRKAVGRSMSMPKNSRLAGWFRKKKDKEGSSNRL